MGIKGKGKHSWRARVAMRGGWGTEVWQAGFGQGLHATPCAPRPKGVGTHEMLWMDGI